MISCQVKEEILNKEIDNIVDLGLDNQPDYFSIIIRVNLSDGKASFEFKDIQKQSMLLKQEKIENVYEYERNKLVVSLYPDDILITKDWKKVQVI